MTFKGKAVIEKSPLGVTVDNIDLGRGVKIGKADRYEINETYAWRGVHSTAVNHCNGAKLSLTHAQNKMAYVLDVRVFNEKKNIAAVKTDDWAAPPLTFKLPNNAGYASITESAIINYSGIGLQANGQRSFQVRLGHEVPASYPYILRYKEDDAKRLSAPAAISGTIKTPWRVVLIGADLNTLVNSDIIHNLAPAPDQKLFPEGFATPWLKPGRAVWGYLNNGGRTLEAMKEFSRLAGELGFEYNLVEGHWQRWPESEQKELVDYSNARNVKVIFWKHSRALRDPKTRREFFEHLHKLGVAGAKIDFFDHEAKAIMDLYQACLKEAAEYQLIIDFHGANKPAGEARAWPNEMTREGIRGYEFRGPWAAHNTTLPFTRMLAGHADYTPMHFGDRRTDTSEAHQIASAIIFTSPLLVYAEHPQNILNHAMLVRDEKGNAATVSLVRKRETFGPRPGVIVDTTTVKNNDSFFVELVAGGGFVALLSK